MLDESTAAPHRLARKLAIFEMQWHVQPTGLMGDKSARPSTPGLQSAQFAVRVPLPGVQLPELIVTRIADKALADIVNASASAHRI